MIYNLNFRAKIMFFIRILSKLERSAVCLLFVSCLFTLSAIWLLFSAVCLLYQLFVYFLSEVCLLLSAVCLLYQLFLYLFNCLLNTKYNAKDELGRTPNFFTDNKCNFQSNLLCNALIYRCSKYASFKARHWQKRSQSHIFRALRNIYKYSTSSSPIPKSLWPSFLWPELCKIHSSMI